MSVSPLRSIRCGFLLAMVALLAACTGLPKGVAPVEDFDLSRYLGTWYEVARLDHRFERGLERVTATYELNEDGSVKVTNRGFNGEEREWSEAIGKAKFVGDPSTGHLKVAFFGPFYASYVIFDLSEDYRLAAVSGHSKSYLWVLARTPNISESDYRNVVNRAQSQGFATDELIRVVH